MKSAFLDANVLFSAALPGSSLKAALEKSGLRLVSSEYCEAEALRNLADYAPGTGLNLNFDRVPDCFDPLPETARLPEKDRPVLASAIAAGVDFLVTGDRRHFGALYGKIVGGVQVIRPRDLPPGESTGT
jgi:uncharacterized protein